MAHVMAQAAHFERENEGFLLAFCTNSIPLQNIGHMAQRWGEHCSPALQHEINI